MEDDFPFRGRAVGRSPRQALGRAATPGHGRFGFARVGSETGDHERLRRIRPRRHPDRSTLNHDGDGMTFDRAWCLETLRGLVRINSINPKLKPDAPGEGEIARYTADRLRGIGLEVEL